jgi:hypothetical protein
MRSDEVKFAEAVASLTARLEAWGVDSAPEHAEKFMRDMLHNGWRPRALATVPSFNPEGTRPPANLSDVRAKLKSDQLEYQAKVRELRDARNRPTTEETS